jgi:tetratricopeptide (TPR) repeat protein
VLNRALDLAVRHEARRAEMRARAQRASLLVASGEPDAAIEASRQPLNFYSEHGFPRAEADAKNILVRAYGLLERYAEAAAITKELISFAQTTKDDSLLADSLEGLAGQLEAQGQLPEALRYQQQLEQLYRGQKHDVFLPYALNNKAQFLVRLGRGEDAAPLLDEVEDGARQGKQSYVDRLRRAAVWQAMRACIEERFREVESWAGRAKEGQASKPDENYRWGQVLHEYARARLRSSREAASVMVGWLNDVSDRPVRREMSYWVVQTLLARGFRDEAGRLALATWQDKVAAGNAELRWRLGALIYLTHNPDKLLTQFDADGATMRAGALREIQSLKAAWPSHADRYLARPDLALLYQRLR